VLVNRVCNSQCNVVVLTLQDNAKENGESKADEQVGLMEEDEVAEQMQAQDFMQPQAEQPELQVPEDLNLDNDAMDQVAAGADDEYDAEADATEQDMHQADEPANTADAGVLLHMINCTSCSSISPRAGLERMSCTCFHSNAYPTLLLAELPSPWLSSSRRLSAVCRGSSAAWRYGEAGRWR
jgi:hypothetical protein